MKKVVKYQAAAAMAAILCMACAASAWPQEKDVFETSYACYDFKGEQRWQATTQISAPADRQKGNYLLVEKGDGYYSGFKGKVSWVATLDFQSDENIVRPLKMRKEVFDASRQKVSLETQEFDYAGNTVEVVYEDLVLKKKRQARFNFSGDVANQLILGLYVQKFLEQGREKAMFEIVSGEPHIYKVYLRRVKKENIEVNGRSYAAYKLCLDPELGILSVAKIFLPKAYVWHSSLPKFEWLRYKGLEASLDSPQVEIRTLDK